MRGRLRFRLIVAAMVAGVLLMLGTALWLELEANDGDWRCLFAQCRIEKGQCPK